MLFGTFASTIVNLEVIFQTLRLSQFPEKDVTQRRFVWSVTQPRHDTFPIADKSRKIIVEKPYLQRILNRIQRFHLLIRHEVLIKEVENLSSPCGPGLGCFRFLEDQDFTGQFTSCDLSQSCEEFGVEGEKLSWITQRFVTCVFVIRFHPLKSFIGRIRGCSNRLPRYCLPRSVRLRARKFREINRRSFFDFGFT